jgi:hypothetical protein
MNTLLKHINNGQPPYQESLDASWATFEACISPDLKECWNNFKPGMLGIQPDEIEEVRKALHDEDINVLSVQMINWLCDTRNRHTKEIIIDVFCDNLVL